VCGKVLVTLLVTVCRVISAKYSTQIRNLTQRTVLRDIVKVVPADNDRTGHLRRDDATREDAATDGNVAGKGALLVCLT
jgi:hypothetical protein